MSLRAELGSLASSLDALVDRITELADGTEGTTDDDLRLALIEVERHLRSGGRRLERVLRDLPGAG